MDVQVEEFLERFDLDLICRGHQLCSKGHEFFAEQRLLTIFSAPNYCGQFDNAAGVLSISKDLECEISTFRPTKTPTTTTILGNRLACTSIAKPQLP